MAKTKSKRSKGKGRGFGNRFPRKAKAAAKSAPKAASSSNGKRRRIVEQPAKPNPETEAQDDDDEGIDTASSADAAEAAPAPEEMPTADDERGMQTVTRKVTRKLTVEERAAKGAEIGRAEVEIEVLKTRVSEINGEKRKLEGHRNKLGHVLDAGEELREVECDREPDFTAQCFVIRAKDTGEVVDRQPMTKDDFQLPLGHSVANGNGNGDDPEADPAPDGSLRTMADEHAGSDDDELGPIDLDDSFVEDDESEARHLDA